MGLLSAIILGVIQGVAEFLPISSSGHLALATSFFKLDSVIPAAFDVLLHLGTLVAVFIVYYRDIFALIPAFFTMLGKVFRGKLKLSEYTDSERMVVFILIATLPLVVLAVTGLEDRIEAIENYPAIIAGILIFNGLVLLISDRLSSGRVGINEVKPRNALVVGICQMLAVLPGLSRSGSTITGGLFQNFSREFAVKFSFILSIPAILGSAVMKVDDVMQSGIVYGDILMYAVGFVTAAVFGLLSIKLLIYISKKASFTYFAYYCFAVGVASLIYSVFFMK